MLSLHWAVECMVNMRQTNVLLETSSTVIRETLLEPHCFPKSRSLLDRIKLLLPKLGSWSISHAIEPKNRVAQAIAGSVVAENRTQSYIAIGGLSWLSHTILHESRAM